MNEELRRDLDRFAEENEAAIFRDIARLVAINSVEGEPAEGAPFGPGPKAALEKGLEIARELGLKSVNCAHGKAFPASCTVCNFNCISN